MKQINRIASCLGVASIMSMALLISLNIIGRKLGIPLPGSISLAGFMLVVVTFLSLSTCEQEDGHVRLESLLFRLSKENRTKVLIATDVLAVIAYGLMFWAAGANTVTSVKMLEVVESDIVLPVYPVKIVLSIGIALMIAQLVLNMISLIKKHQTESLSEKLVKEAVVSTDGRRRGEQT